MVDKNTVIISKKNNIIYQLNINNDINIKIKKFIYKILKLLDIKKIKNDVLIYININYNI